MVEERLFRLSAVERTSPRTYIHYRWSLDLPAHDIWSSPDHNAWTSDYTQPQGNKRGCTKTPVVTESRPNLDHTAQHSGRAECGRAPQRQWAGLVQGQNWTSTTSSPHTHTHARPQYYGRGAGLSYNEPQYTNRNSSPEPPLAGYESSVLRRGHPPFDFPVLTRTAQPSELEHFRNAQVLGSI